MKNKVTVNIYGRSYPMVTDETPEYTERIAKALNDRFANLREQKRSLNIQDAAAIISLECMDALIKGKQTEQNIRTQISAYADDAKETREELAKVKAENEKLKQNPSAADSSEVEALKAELEKAKTEINDLREYIEVTSEETTDESEELKRLRRDNEVLNERVARLERENRSLKTVGAAESTAEQVISRGVTSALGVPPKR